MAVIGADAWSMQADDFLSKCRVELGLYATFAVRSDAAVEDGLAASNAGRFRTELDVRLGDLGAAISRVQACLPGHRDDQILIQPMLENCGQFGVASTHRISDGAPWYCVEYASADCSAVTAGRATGRQLAWPRRTVEQGDALSADAPAAAAAALRTLREIELLIPGQALEIEFATTSDVAELKLLQVRPLASAARWPQRPKQIAKVRKPPFAQDHRTDIIGQQTVYALMSDWNPAELIGSHPRPLALGIFKALITDDAWWQARAQLGYRRTPKRAVPLLRVIAGRPFVDVRRSANSLLPDRLPDSLGGALVDRWISTLRQQPELHDKLEFEVLCSARDLRSPSDFAAAFAPTLGTTGSRLFESALRELTLPMMQLNPMAMAPTLSTGAWLADESNGGSGSRSLRARLRLARQAALEFAKLARVAFAAEAQLRSAVAEGAISADRANALRVSGGGLRAWLARSDADARGSDQLRPSSFDITQPLWLPESNARDLAAGAQPTAAASSISLRDHESRALARLLSACGLNIEPAAWAKWVADATLAREWGKYRFSQPLGRLLELIADAGARLGMDRDQLSWLSLRSAQQLLTGTLSPRAAAERIALAQRRAQAESLHLLRPVLGCASDIENFDSLGILPNFIGSRSRYGPLRVLENGDPHQPVQPGEVVAVRHADPGYDWLFERGIAGLVTAWGGAHSHMGVRCAEHGVTAALGCGEAVWAQARRAHAARIAPADAALWLY